MQLLVISYEVEGVKKEVEFPNTKKGNSDSIKFIQALHKARTNHHWFYKLDQVTKLTAQVETLQKRNSKTKRRYQLEAELKRAEEDRQELLFILDINSAPGPIKLEIFKR